VDQVLAVLPEDPEAREQRRRMALAGGYRLRRARTHPDVTLVGVGAVLPEVITAADEVELSGYAVDVVCLTSPDLVFRALQARQGLARADDGILDDLFPEKRASPLVTVLDGHPHTLSFLGAIRNRPLACLGVTDFGQSGEIDDLYRYFGIDPDTIVGAALDVIQA